MVHYLTGDITMVDYESPSIETLGTVADFTQGNYNSGFTFMEKNDKDKDPTS